MLRWMARSRGERFAAAGMLALGGVVMGAQGEPASTAESWVARGAHGMVASDSREASRAGVEILKAGGNAIDAAAATAFALAVTRPYSAGLGGGGFLMVRFAESGQVFILDYRETAPSAATADMFVKARAAHPDAPPPSRFGGLAVAVPGHVAGHATLLKRFGRKTLAEVVEPARKLAAEGFAVDDNYRGCVEDGLQDIEKHRLPSFTGAIRTALLCDGRVPAIGEKVRQPDMARTLERIGREGPDAFYRGEIARAIVDSVRKAGGVLTLEDLAQYKPAWREPIRSKYRQFEVLLMPPPSSGGICIAETLNILENWPLARIHQRDAGLAAHLTVEAIKHAFADRARYLGDADFVKVPVEKLTSEDYARELSRRIKEDATIAPKDYGLRLPEDAGTTHFCVADQWGNVVAATETINLTYGSLVVAEGTGVVLNNEMDDFTAEPGKANAFGLQQSDLNLVAPHKRPLSSMSPTIVLENGKPVLAVGASGGPRIITATLHVMLNVIEYGEPLGQAIGRPRFHHQWDPDEVSRNTFKPDDPVIEGLRRRGHKISDKKRDAVVQGLQIKDGAYIGASDPRKGGEPAGY